MQCRSINLEFRFTPSFIVEFVLVVLLISIDGVQFLMGWGGDSGGAELGAHKEITRGIGTGIGVGRGARKVDEL